MSQPSIEDLVVVALVNRSHFTEEQQKELLVGFDSFADELRVLLPEVPDATIGAVLLALGHRLSPIGLTASCGHLTNVLAVLAGAGERLYTNGTAPVVLGDREAS